MTQAKAASLTSALFARKGAASPARMVISELDGTDAEEISILQGHAKGRGKDASQRAKANPPGTEQELPLLAFVEARLAEDGPIDVESAGPAEAEQAEERSSEALPAGDAMPSPAASLLERKPLAGRSDDAAPMVDPARAAVSGASVASEALAAAAAEIAGAGEQAASHEEPADKSAEPSEDVRDRVTQDGALASAAATAGETPEAEMRFDSEAASEPEAVRREVAVVDKDGASSEEGVGAERAPEKPVSNPPVSETPLSETLATADGDGNGNGIAFDPTTANSAIASDQKPVSPAPRPSSQSPAPQGPAPRGLTDLQASEPRRRPAEARNSPPRSSPLGSRSPWRMAAVVVLGIALGLAGYAFWPGKADAPSEQFARSEPVEAAPASPMPVEAAETAGARDAAPGTRDPEVQASSALEDPSARLDPAAAAAVDPPVSAAGGVAGSGPVAGSDPSFDIIRIEPNGQSIVAGRADPFSEWIVLNNGEPIGSVRADANGEWVILPDASLVPGANDFSLVPKSERGKVAIPAVDRGAVDGGKDQPAAEGLLLPRSDNRGGSAGSETDALARTADVALPRLKPAGLSSQDAGATPITLTPGGAYAVQFASVRKSDAAEQELARLTRAYPGLLGDLSLRVQEASITGSGVFYRLRSGPLEDLSQAREVCRRLELQGQSCLVVVRAVGSQPDASRRETLVPSLPALKPTQQAGKPG